MHKKDMVAGAIIFAAGDGLAATIGHEFSWQRLAGMAVLGGSLYAWEIPAFFGWIDRRFPLVRAVPDGMLRAALSTLFFNPLWIARHLAFIRWFQNVHPVLSGDLLTIGLRSFVYALPVALSVNYGLQNILAARHRFWVSSVFSGIMAVYYALSAAWS